MMLNLNKELKEFVKSFKEVNGLTRVVMLVWAFLSLSSLTELSSKVVAWKGFILNGLDFYRSIFVEPLIYFTSFFGLSYTEQEIHVATVSSICIAIGMRVQAMGHIVAFRKISEKYGNEIKPNLTYFWVVSIIGPIGIWLGYGITNPNIHLWRTIFVSISLPIFMTAPKYLLAKFSDYEYFEKGSFSYFKSYYIYIISLLSIICVLAAINTGLNENPDASNKSMQLPAKTSTK